jgi:heme oxygenase
MNSISQLELRNLCSDNHTKAEKTTLAKALISGNIAPTVYKNLCYQSYLICDTIESLTTFEHNDLYRRRQFVQDVAECPAENVYICDSTKRYINYLHNIKEKSLCGHIYTHYMGWLYGGQLIAKTLDLPKNHLKFENVKAAVDYVRQHILVNLTMDDVAEANNAFSYVIEIYEELMP